MQASLMEYTLQLLMIHIMITSSRWGDQDPVVNGPAIIPVDHYRISGYWVLDFNDVSKDWDGTVAIQDTLFASTNNIQFLHCLTSSRPVYPEL